MMERFPDLKVTRVVVSEAGASVYSASELAAQEFPDLDVTLRGAVSIARRLQDPLAELVKIDPKAIGVGQYQHDVNQRELARSLDAVVEDCVNAVGVDVNTASAALLARVSGLNSLLAKNIVAWRDENGAFATRSMLLKVPRFGDKAFEQAAGFLRIPNGDNPLDASSVHPEAYPVVERIVAKIKAEVKQIIGQREALKGVSPSDFTDERFGLPTVRDIFAELEKPGRDPRPEFKTAQFKEGVETLNDLYPGMVLEGVVTNVANFGAFVDIGVHQDGLVHISALAESSSGSARCGARGPDREREGAGSGRGAQARGLDHAPERHGRAGPALGRRRSQGRRPSGPPWPGRRRPRRQWRRRWWRHDEQRDGGCVRQAQALAATAACQEKPAPRAPVLSTNETGNHD